MLPKLEVNARMDRGFWLWLGFALFGVGLQFTSTDCSAAHDIGTWLATVGGTVIICRVYYRATRGEEN